MVQNKRGSDVAGKTFVKALRFRLVGISNRRQNCGCGSFCNEGFGGLKVHANANANPCFLMSRFIFTSFL